MSDVTCIHCGKQFGYHEAHRLDEEDELRQDCDHTLRETDKYNKRDCGCRDFKDRQLGWMTKPCDTHQPDTD